MLGNHTDYNEGVVLGAAIDRGINVTGTVVMMECFKFVRLILGKLRFRFRNCVRCLRATGQIMHLVLFVS